MGIRLSMLVIRYRTTAWHFLCTGDQYVLKIRMLYRNIFSLAGNGKLHLWGQSHFYAKLSNCKRHKFGTLLTCTIISKRKISASPFQSKTEVGKKKNIFTVIQFLLLPFTIKLTSFPVLLLLTYTKQHRSFTAYLCAESLSIKTLKAFHWTELQWFYVVMLCKTHILTNCE
jgi:hypothetical protein